MTENLNEVQQKIVNILKISGPSLPVHISKATGVSPLFAGAYLSELYGRGIVKISKLKVGNSPLYFLDGQDAQLERFISYLPEKEREACVLLMKQGLLNDKEQEPAIRVALRNIKDFAIPLNRNNNLVWRYMTYKENQIPYVPQYDEKKIVQEPEKSIEVEKKEDYKKQAVQERAEAKIKPHIISSEELKKQAEKLIEKTLVQEEEPKEIKQKPIKKKKQEEIFLERIKEYLIRKQVEIEKIEKNDKKQVVAVVSINKEKHLLIAYNKRRFDETDLLKAYKKYSHLNLDLYLVAKNDVSPKTKETIRACKRLRAIGMFEEE